MMHARKNKETLLCAEWFDSHSAVFARLSNMISDGWVVSQREGGLVDGDLVARPIKREGEDTYSGVTICKVNYIFYRR